MPDHGSRARLAARRASPALLSTVVACLTACVSGCGSGNREPRATDGAQAASDPPPAAGARVATRPDTLRLSLDVPAEAAPGAPVPITLRVENAGASPRTLFLRGRTPTFDVRVIGERGDTLWHRLEDEMVQGILAIRELAPGEALVLGDTWPQRTNAGAAVPPGRYAVHATLLTDTPDGLAFPPATLRIGAR